mmetsp:Transcript_14005/g.27542  ORF Transcript_14005/g.27542 Transcript_14005/m.27542 type:complete len:242 (-) Transcript_14005:118-843(-)
MRKAIRNGHLLKVKKLIARGEPVEARTPGIEKSTALLEAGNWDKLEIVRYLVNEAKANVEAKAAHTGSTTLCIASDCGYLEIVRCLVEDGMANTEAECIEKNTALIRAASNGFHHIVRYLAKDSKANVEARNMHGDTALTIASRRGYYRVVRILVDEANANIDVKDGMGTSPLEWARAVGCGKMVDCLKSAHERRVRKRHMKIFRRDLKSLEMLLPLMFTALRDAPMVQAREHETCSELIE